MSDEQQHEEDATIAHLNHVLEVHGAQLMQKPNVIGVGIGFRQVAGELTEERCLVVMVSQKLPEAQVSAEDAIPTEIDGAPVDVQEMGNFTAFNA